jgi:predicted ferric reductase
MQTPRRASKYPDGEFSRPAIGPSLKNVLTWAGVYFSLALLPLAIAAVGEPPPARGFWIEFGVGLGFVAFAMIALQFVLTARFRRIASPFGMDTLLHFHRQAGIAAFVFTLAHPLILLAAYPPFLAFLDPRVLFLRAVALWSVLVAVVLLIGTTLWRKPLGLAYQWWRTGHGLLAVAVLFIGIVHMTQVSYYGEDFWKRSIWILMAIVAASLLVYSRLLKPLRMYKSPYRIAEIQKERGQCWTVTLEPVGHAGMRFRAGQFAWLVVGPSPFVMDAHPFSFASSAEKPGRIALTIKELGDFTSAVGEIKQDTTAFLEGPYGAFTLPAEATGAVFIPGGIGITPMMSMLRTMRDRKDLRPIVLIYAVKNWDAATFREELTAMEEVLNLRIVYVVERPPEGWHGESGYLTPELLQRHLPADQPGFAYFICGPEPMMDVVEPFLRGSKIPARRVNAERFNIA